MSVGIDRDGHFAGMHQKMLCDQKHGHKKQSQEQEYSHTGKQREGF